MMKKIVSLLMCICMGFMLISCESQPQTSESTDEYMLYYLNREETKLVTQPYETTQTQKDELIAELLAKLKEAPEEKNLEPTIGSDLEFFSVQIHEEQLTINFAETYKNLETTKEILVRAAIVRTLTQIEGIRTVSFTVNGAVLTDAMGKSVGMMDSSSFIDNAGSEINAYEEASMQLYFANEDGTKLVAVTRDMMYNTNISMEKLVMEQLILGPNAVGSFPTMSPDTKINNITVKDGICYVNLSEDFLTAAYTVNSEITIYSIVNTLTTLSSVNKVQILVDGESAVTFRENISLETVFSRNLDIVETTDK